MDEQRDFVSEAVDTGAFIWALTCDSPTALAHKKAMGAATYSAGQFMLLVRDFEQEIRKVKWLDLMKGARKHIADGSDSSFVDLAENEHLDVTRRLLALEAAQRGMPTPVFRLLMIEQDVKNCGGDVAERRFRSATEKMVSWGYVQDCIEIGVKRVLH